jgi:calpain-15
MIEKGYAKLYGNYSNICAGQIPLALADLNFGGFPETVMLREMQSNAATFMDFLQRQMKMGTMLGVGSAESKGGDKDDNGRGIVMNHAYAIL